MVDNRGLIFSCCCRHCRPVCGVVRSPCLCMCSAVVEGLSVYSIVVTCHACALVHDVHLDSQVQMAATAVDCEQLSDGGSFARQSSYRADPGAVDMLSCASVEAPSLFSWQHSSSCNKHSLKASPTALFRVGRQPWVIHYAICTPKLTSHEDRRTICQTS